MPGQVSVTINSRAKGESCSQITVEAGLFQQPANGKDSFMKTSPIIFSALGCCPIKLRQQNDKVRDQGRSPPRIVPRHGDLGASCAQIKPCDGVASIRDEAFSLDRRTEARRCALALPQPVR